MTTLYEIKDTYLEALENLTDQDLPEDAIKDTLDGLSGELQEKGRNVAAYIQHLEMTESAMKEAESRMAARRKAIEKRRRWLLDYLKRNMEECGISKIECPEFSVRIQDNPPSVDVYDQQSLPAEYLVDKIVTTVNKVELAKALKSGEEVRGACLNRGTRLVVK